MDVKVARQKTSSFYRTDTQTLKFHDLPSLARVKHNCCRVLCLFQGIYDIHIRLAGVPLLPWMPPPLSRNTFATEVMSHPVVCFRPVETVRRIYQVLKEEKHNGFPVVENWSSVSSRRSSNGDRLDVSVFSLPLCSLACVFVAGMLGSNV